MGHAGWRVTGCQVPGAMYRVPGAECRVPGAGCQVQGAGCRSGTQDSVTGMAG
jgi:hypothetical protein